MSGAALGFDIGTTSVKAGLLWLDEPGGQLEVVRRPNAPDRPRPGWVQQEPSTWLEAMASCWTELRQRHPDVELRSVGIVSQVNTHILTDGSMVPLHPAITWQDTRAAREAAHLDQSVADRRETLWGGPFTVDASFALSRLAWFAAHAPEARSRARWLLSPKDYCIAAITGTVVTDAISPVGLVGPDERYLEAVLDLVDGAAELLPPIGPFDAAAGTVRADDPVGLPAGVPVSIGTMDAWGNVFGSGLVRAGRAMEVAGTSEIVAVLADEAVPTRGIISFPPVRGGRLHAGPTQAGGEALEWAARGLGRSIGEVLSLAAEGRRDPQPLVFLPHLAGERAPYWNPAARGVILGLTTGTEPRHLALAVLEGVALAARQVLEACEAAAGLTAHRLAADDVRLSGGGARSRLWNSVKASVHGRPLSVLLTLESGVLGATLLGIVAAGLADDLGPLAEEHARIAEVVEPELAERARLDDLYGVYREAYAALVPLFPRLVGVAS
jgi:xylulokinase